jgi:predicted glycoside hydrolase/deacetylase ChbG (UPF0249 family)
MSGLLIINADDWGMTRHTTDAIARCFVAGTVSSTTAMVYMSDSRRAAEIAVERGLSVGLHINLDNSFTASDIPHAVRAGHEAIRPWFANRRRRPWMYNPDRRFRRRLRSVLEAQIERFNEDYGRPPTHIDGHHQIHMDVNVLLSPALRRGTAMRRTERPPRGTVQALWGGGRDRMMRWRYRTPSRFYDLRAIHPDFAGAGWRERLAESRTDTMEIMVHPGLEDELRTLLSPEWTEAIAELPLGSYDGLARPVGP